MEFGSRISKMSVGEVVKGTATEGGAVVAGLLGAGILGKQIEKNLGTAGSKAVTTLSPVADKVIAFGINNVPKLALWYLVRKEGGQYIGSDLAKDVGKGALGSVVLDTLIRATNKGAPREVLTLFGYNFMGEQNTAQMSDNMQKVLQENSSLRNQLNGALQRIASASPNVTVTPVQTSNFPPDHDRQFGMMQSTPDAEERRKRYGAMTPPIEDERNRKFSSMKAKFNFAGDSESTSTAFGML